MSEPVEPATTPAPPAWRPIVWGPLLLLAAHGLFALFLNPIHNGMREEGLGGVLIGVLLWQPVVCAAWAALAWAPPLHRWPCGLAALALLTLLANLFTWNIRLVLIDVLLGLASAAFFAGFRWRTAWVLAPLAATSEPRPDRPATRFSVRYLLGWTSVVAVLCAIATAVSPGSGPSAGDFGGVFGFFAIMLLLVAPALGIAYATLTGWGRGWRWAAFALAWAACIAAACAISTQMRSNSIGQTVSTFSCFSLGSVLASGASALILRWSGYRLVRTAPSEQGADGR